MNARCIGEINEHEIAEQSLDEQTFADDEFFEVEQCDGATLVTFVKSALNDANDKHEIRNALLDLLSDVSIKYLVANMSLVRHCSIEVVGDLLAARREVVQGGGNLYLCSLQPTVYEKLRGLKLAGNIFTIFDSQTEALQATT